jgi:hypothetical protein
MRYYAVTEIEAEPFRIIAEYIGGYDWETDDCTHVSGDAMNWKREHCRSEAELLDTEEGRLALERWEAGDDSVHLAAEREARRRYELEDRREEAGRAARPDLVSRFDELIDAGDSMEALTVLKEIKAAGGQLIDA